MDFVTYLTDVHNETSIGKKSVKQYDNRLYNMKKKNIYNEERVIDERIKRLINEYYHKDSRHYEKTLVYYIAYKKHLKTLTQK